MSLKDTEEKLYNPKSGIEKRKHSESIFDEENIEKNKIETEKFEEKKRWWERFSFAWFSEENRKPFVLGLAILLVIVVLSVLAVTVYKLKQTAFSEEKVSVQISGRSTTKSAEKVKYTVTYKNQNRVSLENAEIILNYPDTFYPEESSVLRKTSERSSRIDIGTIKPFSSKEIVIEGRFYAAENYVAYIKPILRYKPENFNSRFQTESQIGVTIVSSPISLKVSAPKEALDESTVEYKITYKNEGETVLRDLNLRAEYPEGFVYQGAEPSPVEESDAQSVWHLGEISPQQEGVLTIKGKIEGNRYDTKNIKVAIFKNDYNHREILYGKADAVTKIVVPPLAISHKINGKSFTSVNLGDVLDYQINYSNVGDVSLRDVIIKLELDSPIIDYQNLRLQTGAFNGADKTITWKASDIPQLKNLEPGDGGVIEFEVPLRKQLNINDVGDRNFTIESKAMIDSSDIAFDTFIDSKNISNKVIVKLNSLLTLNALVRHNDFSAFENTGPLPPVIGKETQYALTWRVGNYFNNVSDVTVRAFLPTGIRWTGKVYPENEDVSFNERTNEVVWKIGKMPAGTGTIYKNRECSFQVAVTPEVNQFHKSVPLIGESVLSAKDDFTLSNIEVKSPERNTRKIDDANTDDFLVEKSEE